MKKIEQMALNEISQKSSSIRMNAYTAKSHLQVIKQNLMHCDPKKMDKEFLGELIAAAQKAISEVDKVDADNILIGEWAESLKTA
jgi:hypothetical protein